MNILLVYEDDKEKHNFFSGLSNDLLSFLKTTNGSFPKIFTNINIANSGIKEILQGKNCKTAIEKIRNEYSFYINDFENIDSIARSNLSKNYRALVIEGDENYKIEN